MGGLTYVDSPGVSVTRLWARNFRSIRELRLDLEPLTVLVGPNASGKSNVLDVLRFISDALRSDLESAINARQGIGAVRRSAARGGRCDVEVGLKAEGDRFWMEYGFVLGSRGDTFRVKREAGTVSPSAIDGGQVRFEVKEGRITRPRELAGLGVDSSDLALPHLSRFLFPHMDSDWGRLRWKPSSFHDATGVLPFVSSMRFYRILPDAIRNPRMQVRSQMLAEDGSNLAPLLGGIAKRRSPSLGEIKRELGQAVPGLTDLKAQLSRGVMAVRLRHGVGESGSTVDLSQESDGTVRILGLLTALHQDFPPSLMGIE